MDERMVIMGGRLNSSLSTAQNYHASSREHAQEISTTISWGILHQKPNPPRQTQDPTTQQLPI